MRLALVTRPLTDDKLHLAAQIGVTDIVADWAGYTMLGRLHAIGYMQGLIEAARAAS
ncbi:MAG: hypothetical protein O2923_09090 [Verrucomicrobia bacterium]|nr:hypothetical protein [Verrucomicrobiota bacterium]MDA1087863.1 hypothetical protein [Verrucomicrobiota bacterium]